VTDVAGRVAPVRDEDVGPVIPTEAIASGGLSWRWLAGGVIALAAALFAGLTLGPAGIPADAVLGDLVSRLPVVGAGTRLDELEATILWEIRAPRVALGALVGAMLALAGGSYQAVFHNPLADPYLLGVARAPASAPPSQSPASAREPRCYLDWSSAYVAATASAAPTKAKTGSTVAAGSAPRPAPVLRRCGRRGGRRVGAGSPGDRGRW
jgi:hypothetical protein